MFGDPANKVAGGDSGESIAMTAPVVTGSPSLDKGEREGASYSIVALWAGWVLTAEASVFTQRPSQANVIFTRNVRSNNRSFALGIDHRCSSLLIVL